MSELLFTLFLFGSLLFFVLGVNYYTQRVDIDKISQKKKELYLRRFWYFYSILYLVIGLFDIIHEKRYIMGGLWISISIVVLYSTYNKSKSYKELER